MNRSLNHVQLLAVAVFCLSIAVIVPAVSATTTFRYSSMGGGDSMMAAATGWGDYNSVSVYEQGVGNYGFIQTPEGVRGGWSTRGSSGGFGYRTDVDGDYGNGNQGGLTSFGVNSRGFRGSYADGYGMGGYGSFVVGNGRIAADPYYSGHNNAWGAYPLGIPYVGSGGWSTGYGASSYGGAYRYAQGSRYSYARNSWY